MRKVLLFMALALAFAACQPDKGYVIRGKVADAALDNQKVYMQAIDTVMNVDSATITNGTFELKGNVDSAVVRLVYIGKDLGAPDAKVVPVLLEPGTKLEISFDSLITVKGNAVNEAYSEVRAGKQGLLKKMQSVMQRYNDSKDSGTLTDSIEMALSDEYDAISKEHGTLVYNFAKGNMQNKLGEFVFQNNFNSFDDAQLKELIALSSDSFKNEPFVKKLAERLENIEKVAVGKKFTDFTLKTPEGKDVKLSDYAGKGKFVLIDFWASWCGPCREEMPTVVEAYKKYKAKGFEIVGVSLDQNQADWVKGIKALNITWPQMSDLKAWKSDVVPLYGIQGIPHTVLLDKEGAIIAKDLRGKELLAKLAELMP